MKEQVDEQLQINENLRARIDELLQANLTANARLKETDAIVAGFRIEDTNARMHALEEEVKSLTSKAKQMEQERQQMDYLKKKTDEDMRDLIKQNVDLVQQRDEIKRTLAKERKDLQDRGKEQDASKEETDQRRHELSRLKDDLGMLRISNDNKDRKISELHQQIKTNESANNKSKRKFSVCLVPIPMVMVIWRGRLSHWQTLRPGFCWQSAFPSWRIV
ncbi:hypothetical protein BC831DRAFT_56226 [Entophlyctis helioformis]|nr:hypothetical protein BC831DRAFT_56226 [Entophlyctis helioformis]